MPSGSRVAEITVEHLLTHTAGGWTNDGNDPMFRAPTLGHAQLIATTLRTQPLSTAPGTAYAHSNFGYCLLGRVIEAVTSRPYAVHVAAAVLRPAGATATEVGRNTRAERLHNEVRYHAAGAGDPYGMNVARMDAHGGWVATAADLVGVLSHMDGAASPALLAPDSVRTMTTPWRAKADYAHGWVVNARGNWWHAGVLPGTTSIVVRTHSGFSWAALVNSGGPSSGLVEPLDLLMWQMARAVKSWEV